MVEMKRAVLVTLCAVLACACSSDVTPNDTVVVRYDEEADFETYRTFGFVDRDLVDEGGLQDAPDWIIQNHEFVDQAVREEMLALGYTESEDPDLWFGNVSYGESHGGYQYVCYPGYWWGYWGWYWDPCRWLYPEWISYSIGTVIVGAGDAATEQAVFAGALQGIEDASFDTQERIRSGIARIFAQWPGQPPADAGP